MPRLPQGLSESLIVGPDLARTRFLEMLSQARHSIRIIDHRVSDPQVVALLRNCQAAGMSVQVLGQGAVGGIQSHGKMLLVDDAMAAIGSISLSPPSLNLRREVAVMVHDPGNVGRLRRFFERAWARRKRFAGRVECRPTDWTLATSTMLPMI